MDIYPYIYSDIFMGPEVKFQGKNNCSHEI